MTIRSRMSSIMGVIGLERLEFFALDLEKLLWLTVYTVASTIIITNRNQTWSKYT